MPDVYKRQVQYCAIGSAKSNIGHLEGAAGIAGLTKVLLQMRHRQLAPSIHADTLNPYIDFARSPFRVQRILQPWHCLLYTSTASTASSRAARSTIAERPTR